MKAIGAIALIFVGLIIFNTILHGGCEAQHKEDIEKMDRENKAWQAEKQRNATDADREKARDQWKQMPR